MFRLKRNSTYSSSAVRSRLQAERRGDQVGYGRVGLEELTQGWRGGGKSGYRVKLGSEEEAGRNGARSESQAPISVRFVAVVREATEQGKNNGSMAK